MKNEFTEPKIVTTNDLNTRSYVTFYLNKIRIREYNGSNLNISVSPNRAKSVQERNRLLKKLQFELHKALDADRYPATKEEIIISQIEEKPTTENLLKQALDKKLDSDLSKTYKRNLRLIHNQFIAFLKDHELKGEITQITTVRIDEFLSRFKSSGTYYMDKRRDLGVLFSSVGRIIDLTLNSVKD